MTFLLSDDRIKSCAKTGEELFIESNQLIKATLTKSSFGQCRNCKGWFTEKNLALVGKPVSWQIVYSNALCQDCWQVVPPCSMET